MGGFGSVNVSCDRSLTVERSSPSECGTSSWLRSRILQLSWCPCMSTWLSSFNRAGWLKRGTDILPGRRIPEAMHSMTRRRASPGPSGRLQVAMAFSQISSRGYRGSMKVSVRFVTKRPFRRRRVCTVCVCKAPGFLYCSLTLRPSHTHPLRGCHTGRRLHMSLRILRTMTQDLRSVTLACRDRWRTWGAIQQDSRMAQLHRVCLLTLARLRREIRHFHDPWNLNMLLTPLWEVGLSVISEQQSRGRENPSHFIFLSNYIQVCSSEWNNWNDVSLIDPRNIVFVCFVWWGDSLKPQFYSTLNNTHISTMCSCIFYILQV